MSRYTPAVTSVEECTRAETGVGAAMAAGSQVEKGIWALLVVAASTRRKAMVRVSGEVHELRGPHWPEVSVREIATIISASPIRLVRTVIMPAPRERGFW